MMELLRFWGGCAMHLAGLVLIDPSSLKRWIGCRVDAGRFWLGAWLYQLGRAIVCVAMTMNGNGLSYAQAREHYLDMVERAKRSRREEANG